MKLQRFNQFGDTSLINEDIKQAKAYLKKHIKTKEGEKPTEQQIYDAENNKDFLAIKKMLDKHPGYVYTFTKFFFGDKVPMEELKTVYQRLVAMKNAKGIKPIGEYAKVVPDEEDQRNGFERLSDDLDIADSEKVVNAFVAELPGAFVVTTGPNKGREVPSIRDEYRKAPQAIKDKLKGIALSFETICTDDEGNIDKKACLSNKLTFFRSLKRYQGLNEVIQAAQANLRSANNLGVNQMIRVVNKANQQYGEINGAEIVFNENEVLVLDIKSYQTNKLINSNTKHCIKDNLYQWDSYVGGDEKFNKQYYIYNFNLEPSDNLSVIGVTIDSNHSINAAHAKDDGGVSSYLKSYLKQWQKEYDLSGDIYNEVLIPMSPEDIAEKKRRVKANRELKKDGLSIEQIRGYISDGGDPNVDNGKPLEHLIKADRIDDVDVLLSDLGALTDIGNTNDYPIKYTKSFDMLKMLIKHGATITSRLIEQPNILGNYDIMKYLLDNGANPNDGKGLALRNAVQNHYYDVLQLLFEYGGIIDNRASLTTRIIIDHDTDGVCVDMLLNQIEKENLVSPEKIGRIVTWLNSPSCKTKKEIKIKYLKGFIEIAERKNDDHEFIDEALAIAENE